MTDPAAIQLPDIVTLKVNGKAYTCGTKVKRAKCKSKNFRVYVPVTQVAGQIDDLDTLAANLDATYECVVCGTQLKNEHSFHIEENLPKRDDWMTPGGSVFSPQVNGLWSQLHREYSFNIDVAACLENRKTLLYLDKDADAIKLDWSDENALLAHFERVLQLDRTEDIRGAVARILANGVRAWDNPPYNPVGEVGRWLEKALEQAQRGVFSVHLVPMSTSVGWFNDFVVPFAEWHSFKGRIAFDDPLKKVEDARMSPKQDNLLVIYDPDSDVVGHTAVRDAKTGRKIWTRNA